MGLFDLIGDGANALGDILFTPARTHRGVGPGEFQPRQLGNRTVYTGCDITIVFTINGQPIPIGNISAISYSIHREKVPVRTLGHTYPRGFTRGARTLAGTIVFSVFNRYALAANLSKYRFEPDYGVMNSPLIDQLPPFDATITYINEFGDQSVMRILGIEITDEGQTHSVDDMMIENIVQYVAQDIEVMDILTENTSGAFLGTPLEYGDLNAIQEAIRQVDTAIGYANGVKSILDNFREVDLSDYETIIAEDPTFGSTDIVLASAKYRGVIPPTQAIYTSGYTGEDWLDDINQKIFNDSAFLSAEIANLERRKADLLVQFNTYKLRDNPNDRDNVVPTGRIDPPPTGSS